MLNLAEPRSLRLRILSYGLRVILAVVLAGCAGAPPKPDAEGLRRLKTRQYAIDEATAFDAALKTLEEMGYAADQIDADIGLITANRESSRELAKITDESDDGPSTLATIALIATGIILVILVIGMLAGDGDDEDEEKTKDKDEGTGSDKKTERRGGLKGAITDDEGTDDEPQSGSPTRRKKRQTVTDDSDDSEAEMPQPRKTSDQEPSGSEWIKSFVASEDKDQETKTKERGVTVRNREQNTVTYYVENYYAPDPIVIVHGPAYPTTPSFYHYRLMLNVQEIDPGETLVRVSLQGSRIDDYEVDKTGPVYDPDFYTKFFSNFNRTLGLTPVAGENEVPGVADSLNESSGE